MTATDDSETPVPALPDRARTVRWGHHAARFAMVALLLAAAAVLPTGQGALERLRYREGDIARERVVAPSDFRVQKDDATLRREQEEAALAVPPCSRRRATDAASAGRHPGTRASRSSLTRPWARLSGRRSSAARRHARG
jgi:hypothetical protein